MQLGSKLSFYDLTMTQLNTNDNDVAYLFYYLAVL